jgi:hypothetical protein
MGVMLAALSASAASLPRYYAHEAVTDQYGVIAPWYGGLNGQCDLRVRIAAETLKRYPWTTTNSAVAAYPDYLFTSQWQISSNGVITPENPGDWMNGDLGQRSTSVLNGMVDYYRYSGDPAAIAHLTYMGDYLLDHALTPSDHPWPLFPISVPTKGVPYGKADPRGMIQLDICGDMGRGLLRAYQVTGNRRWFEAAKHWGDLFVANCNLDPKAAPWPRYANPENCPWKGVNEQTGGVVMIISFLDELIRLGYTGGNQEIVAARDAGRRYMLEQLLPRWTDNPTWGLYFWDYPNPEQNCSITAEVASYLVKNTKHFPNWRIDARNILTMFLNRSSADPLSGGDVYSGAWAYPESNSCCKRSLWYAPIMNGAVWAQYGVLADDNWARELGYRQLVLQTYDIHETGVSEDNIDGGIIVNGRWLNIAHPLPLRWILTAIGWLPEELGASRENHLVRSSAVVDSIVYKKGEISYSTFDAPPETIDVFRLSFVPQKITADGQELRSRQALDANGYTVKKLSNGDAIVQIRHDGARKIVITGQDPQTEFGAAGLDYEGSWERVGSGPEILYSTDQPGAAVTRVFEGNQVRLIGSVGPDGGLAEVFIDGEKQLVPIDFWNPVPRSGKVLYYKNGLKPGAHTLRVVALGTRNPYSLGNSIYASAVQFSDQTGAHHFPSGTGPTQPQRMIFGYVGREDYRDAKGGLWKPAGEIVTRLIRGGDTFAAGWITNAAETIQGTTEPELYRYGYRGHDFWVNITVGPGEYDLRLGFANTRGMDTTWNCFDILVNGKKVVDRFDVTATAGEPGRAVDLVFERIAPVAGVVQVRFVGVTSSHGPLTRRGEAFVQALEIGRNLAVKGVQPVSSSIKPAINLLLNAGFEETSGGVRGNRKKQEIRHGWTYRFGGKTNSYAWQERDYQKHPEWGLPEFYSGQGALRTHTDGAGQITVFQEVHAKPNSTYVASVWVRAVDLHGKGFGKASSDSAGLVVEELNRFSQVAVTHPKVETKVAGPYVLLSKTFSTGPECDKLRFSLVTSIRCHYTEGHVTYDECLLREELQ